jgi:predicted thioesterase
MAAMASGRDIRPGLEHRLERVVDDRLITMHVGGKGVFATPARSSHACGVGTPMEGASHKAVEDVLPDGQTTVGYEVHVRHLAPAPPGSTLVVSSRLAEVRDNKLVSEVECRLGDRVIGSGTHKRAIVPANF